MIALIEDEEWVRLDSTNMAALRASKDRGLTFIKPFRGTIGICNCGHICWYDSEKCCMCKFEPSRDKCIICRESGRKYRW